MSLLRLGLIGVAWLGFLGCIDNPNAVGSISSGGSDNPIVVGGGGGNTAAGNGNSTGGTGSGPGSSGGAGATAAVTCRANGQKILLSKAGQSADDCVLISDSGSVTVPGTVTTTCTSLTIGISRAEEGGNRVVRGIRRHARSLVRAG